MTKNEVETIEKILAAQNAVSAQLRDTVRHLMREIERLQKELLIKEQDQEWGDAQRDRTKAIKNIGNRGKIP